VRGAGSYAKRVSGLLPADLVEAARRAGVRDERVLEALEQVPRAAFAPPEVGGDPYLDVPLPIPHAQVTTQPSLVAKMLEALSLGGSEQALEIGTGYGFQTALLARLTAFVWSIERWEDLAATARANLSAYGAGSVEVVVGDGSEGLGDHAPYDAVIVSAAFPTVPPPLVEQLAEGGRLVAPLGSGGDERVLSFVKQAGRLRRRGFVTRAHFVRLYGRHGFAP
jgi:protein-L-isoaspartate(D-aspartate) O-methyltransferase